MKIMEGEDQEILKKTLRCSEEINRWKTIEDIKLKKFTLATMSLRKRENIRTPNKEIPEEQLTI